MELGPALEDFFKLVDGGDVRTKAATIEQVEMSTGRPFGGKSVIAVGDLFQLPAVEQYHREDQARTASQNDQSRGRRLELVRTSRRFGRAGNITTLRGFLRGTPSASRGAPWDTPRGCYIFIASLAV